MAMNKSDPAKQYVSEDVFSIVLVGDARVDRNALLPAKILEYLSALFATIEAPVQTNVLVSSWLNLGNSAPMAHYSDPEDHDEKALSLHDASKLLSKVRKCEGVAVSAVITAHRQDRRSRSKWRTADMRISNCPNYVGHNPRQITGSWVFSFSADMFHGLPMNVVRTFFRDSCKFLAEAVPDSYALFVDYASTQKNDFGLWYTTPICGRSEVEWRLQQQMWNTLRHGEHPAIRGVYWANVFSARVLSVIGGLPAIKEAMHNEYVNRIHMDVHLEPINGGSLYIEIDDFPCYWPEPPPKVTSIDAAEGLYRLCHKHGLLSWR